MSIQLQPVALETVLRRLEADYEALIKHPRMTESAGAQSRMALTTHKWLTMSKKILLMPLMALPLMAGATEYQTVDRPRQECWNEQVRVQAPDYTGANLGGIAGGILGNQVGGGNGRTVATAAGAMAGAVTGDRMSNSRPGYQTVQRCRTVVDHVRVPMSEPLPAYQAPAAVYAPPPVYVQPQPMYVQAQPVVVQPGYGYYAEPDERYGQYWRRAHWRRHHHHRDDDDD